MASARDLIKALLPYPLTCAIARAINRPWMEDVHRTERIIEYSWVLSQVKGPHILDFGWAGSYFAEALCSFGQVTAVDPRHTPRIQHPNFCYRADLKDVMGPPFDTIVCVSVLEHYLDAEATLRALFGRLAPGGQLLVTYPTSLTTTCRRFRGYQELQPDWLRFPKEAQVALCLLVRTPRGWMNLEHGLPLTYEGPNTEHRVTTLACVRVVRRADAVQPASMPAPARDIAQRPPRPAPVDIAAIEAR